MWRFFRKWVAGIDAEIEEEIERRVRAEMHKQQGYLLDQYHQRIQSTYAELNRATGRLHRTIHELRSELKLRTEGDNT